MQHISSLILTPRPLRLAVLIDAENISARYAALLMEQASIFGKPTVRRAYGEWTGPQLTPWKNVLHTLSILPCHQFRYAKGKNASDCMLVMDAMELLLTCAVDGFCIVSSDSDYTGLVGRIQQRGLPVYGFGLRCASPAFMVACDAFVVLDAVELASNAV